MTSGPPPPVEVLPRHMQQAGGSAHSSSSSSPVGTPPTSSQPRSPASATVPLPSPGLATASPPASSNRFGLALNFIQRRPRGHTNPSYMGNGGRSPGGGAEGTPGNGSPNGDRPPSPGGGGERTGGGVYGFPALRRTLSKRATSSTGGTSSPVDSSRSRARRSSSQPAAPVGADAHDAPSSSRTAGGDNTGAALDPPQPSFASLMATTFLPSSNLVQTPTTDAPPASASTSTQSPHRLRLVPHLESSRSLHFEPVDRDLVPFNVLRIGRFTDRSHHNANPDPLRIAFKSKVVSRGHAEIWTDEQGKFFIKDTKSSSGTFLNHIRLSGPNAESRAFPLKDGDVLQLGVDYQGGTEEIYRCVKMRVELNRGWQRSMNTFNTAALAQLRALGGGATTEAAPTAATTTSPSSQKGTAPTASVTDCCICLYPVTVCQSLFIAPCSHVTHFKCIRPLILQNYPGFCCPLCRTYADLEADVEIEPWESEVPVAPVLQPATVDEDLEREEDEPMSSVEEVDETVSRAPSVRLPADSSCRSSLAVSGPDGIPVAFQIAPRRSRPSSIAPSFHEDGVQAPLSPPPPLPTTPLPMSIAGGGGAPSDLSDSDAICASLANATTPSNSTFLSTLADSARGSLPRYRNPVASLDMAFAGQGQSQAGPSVVHPIHRNSFGSEDETDGARGEEDEGVRKVMLIVAGTGTGKANEKGKAREIDPESTKMEVDGRERTEDGIELEG